MAMPMGQRFIDEAFRHGKPIRGSRGRSRPVRIDRYQRCGGLAIGDTNLASVLLENLPSIASRVGYPISPRTEDAQHM